jgi:hypothetical protein
MAKHNLGPLYTTLTNEQADALINNMELIPNVEWEDSKIGNETISYPMWKATVASHTATYQDYLDFKKNGKMFDAKKINEKSGETKVKWSLKNPMEQLAKMKAAIGDTKFINPKTEQKVPEMPKPGFSGKLPGFSKSADKVGVISPSADLGKQNIPKPEGKAPAKAVTNYDSTEDQKVVINKNHNWFVTTPFQASKIPDKVGEVEPQIDMGTVNMPHLFGTKQGWKPKKARVDWTGTADLTVEYAGKEPKVEAKKLQPINFDKFETDHIN